MATKTKAPAKPEAYGVKKTGVIEQEATEAFEAFKTLAKWKASQQGTANHKRVRAILDSMDQIDKYTKLLKNRIEESQQAFIQVARTNFGDRFKSDPDYTWMDEILAVASGESKLALGGQGLGVTVEKDVRISVAEGRWDLIPLELRAEVTQKRLLEGPLYEAMAGIAKAMKAEGGGKDDSPLDAPKIDLDPKQQIIAKLIGEGVFRVDTLTKCSYRRTK